MYSYVRNAPGWICLFLQQLRFKSASCCLTIPTDKHGHIFGYVSSCARSPPLSNALPAAQARLLGGLIARGAVQKQVNGQGPAQGAAVDPAGRCPGQAVKSCGPDPAPTAGATKPASAADDVIVLDEPEEDAAILMQEDADNHEGHDQGDVEAQLDAAVGAGRQVPLQEFDQDEDMRGSHAAAGPSGSGGQTVKQMLDRRSSTAKPAITGRQLSGAVQGASAASQQLPSCQGQAEPGRSDAAEMLQAVLGDAVSSADIALLLQASKGDVPAAANLYFDGQLAALRAKQLSKVPLTQSHTSVMLQQQPQPSPARSKGSIGSSGKRSVAAAASAKSKKPKLAQGQKSITGFLAGKGHQSSAQQKLPPSPAMQQPAASPVQSKVLGGQEAFLTSPGSAASQHDVGGAQAPGRQVVRLGSTSPVARSGEQQHQAAASRATSGTLACGAGVSKSHVQPSCRARQALPPSVELFDLAEEEEEDQKQEHAAAHVQDLVALEDSLDVDIPAEDPATHDGIAAAVGAAPMELDAAAAVKVEGTAQVARQGAQGPQHAGCSSMSVPTSNADQGVVLKSSGPAAAHANNHGSAAASGRHESAAAAPSLVTNQPPATVHPFFAPRRAGDKPAPSKRLMQTPSAAISAQPTTSQPLSVGAGAADAAAAQLAQQPATESHHANQQQANLAGQSSLWSKPRGRQHALEGIGGPRFSRDAVALPIKEYDPVSCTCVGLVFLNTLTSVTHENSMACVQWCILTSFMHKVQHTFTLMSLWLIMTTGFACCNCLD